jgi:hypothetical protein
LAGALLLSGIFSVLCFACTSKKAAEKPKDQETYFSVRQFLDDQWKTRKGQPIALLRITSFNGTSDSSFVNLDSTLWSNIRMKFDQADIGNPKFLDQYRFNLFEDADLQLVNLNYEAKSDELFTQKMNIGVDAFNNRVRSVYIETRIRNKVYRRSQKLYYAPDRVIQIQEYEKSATMPEKDLKVEYHYRY